MSEESKGPRPTHELKLLDIESGDTAVVGVAWAREQGFISVKLNPGVVLSYDNLKGKALTLFKAKTQEEWDAFHAARTSPARSPRSRSGYDGNGGTWRENNPAYVRKVHYSQATKQQCPNRDKGRPELSDDPAKVTCRLCKTIAQGASVTQLPTPEPPKDPPPAA